jgi:hypothetical protein
MEQDEEITRTAIQDPIVIPTVVASQLAGLTLDLARVREAKIWLVYGKPRSGPNTPRRSIWLSITTCTRAGRTRQREKADAIRRELARGTRSAARALRHAGLSTRDVGEILGISGARVAQMDHEPLGVATPGDS